MATILVMATQCFGGTLTWTATDQGEQLVFKFDSRLPDTKPKYHQPNKLIFHLNWSFWQRERKFKLPDLPASALFQNIAYTPEQGIILTMSTDQFDFAFNTRPLSKEFVLDLWSLEPQSEQKQTEAQAIPQDLQDKINEELIDSQDPLEILPDNDLLLPASIEDPDESDLDTPNATNFAPDLNASQPQESATTLADFIPSEPETIIPPESILYPESKPQSKPEPEELLWGMASLRGKVSWPDEKNIKEGFPEILTQTTNDSLDSQNHDSELITPQNEYPQDESLKDHEQDMAQNTTFNGPQDLKDMVTVQDHQALEPTNASHVDFHNQSLEPEWADQIAMALDMNSSNATNITALDAANAANATNAADAANASNATQADLEALYQNLTTALEQQDLQAIQDIANAMLKYSELAPQLREELLYTLADLIWNQGQTDVQTYFRPMLMALEAAKNSNLQSEKVSEILAKIGRLHLLAHNLPEAKGYFDLIRRRYPNYEQIPMFDIYWGQYYLQQENYAKAHEHFQYVAQNYKTEAMQKLAQGGLVKTLAGLEFFHRAQDLVQEIEEKWPTLHHQDPSLLMTAGHIATMLNNRDQAQEYLWAYVNLVPQAQDADIAWARIGDLLVQEKQEEAANKIYNHILHAYPDQEGALIAQMRIAEKGILDPASIPDIQDLDMNPEQVYARIATKKDSALAPIAQLKLAMLHLWEKNYAQTLEEIEHFHIEFPNHSLRINAQEVAQTALEEWILNHLENSDYAAILQLWEQYGSIFDARGPSAQLHLVLATAFWEENHPEQALAMVSPLVFGPLPRGKYSEPALDLMLSILLDLQNWAEIPRLARQVASWNLPQNRQQQLDYATALALENLNDHQGAEPLWLKLATDQDLSETQRGYAHFFLAQSAGMSGNFDQANVLAQKALDFLLQDQQDLAKIRDTLELLIELAEKTNQDQDALAWSIQYGDYLDQQDPQWPAYMWRKALLYKKNNKMSQWRENLEELIQLYPDSLHGRMAASELENERLTQEAQKIR